MVCVIYFDLFCIGEQFQYFSPLAFHRRLFCLSNLGAYIDYPEGLIFEILQYIAYIVNSKGKVIFFCHSSLVMFISVSSTDLPKDW